MKEYVSSVVVNASPDEVWSVLADRAAYAEWNPEITGIDGRLALGGTIHAHVRLGSGAARVVPQRVTVFSPPDHMEWVGGLPFGLFVGRRIYTLTSRATGVEFSLGVRMSGLLAPLILKSVGDRQPELDGFTRALKSRVEQRGRSHTS